MNRGGDRTSILKRAAITSAGSKASVTHLSTAMTEHKDDVEGWQARLAVTMWYEL
jgi:hypothetical protein